MGYHEKNVNSKFLQFVHLTNLKGNFGCHPSERVSQGSSWRVSIGACDKWIKLNLTPRVKSGMAILYSEKYFISKSVIGGRAENSKEFSHSVRTLKHFYVKVDVIFPLKRLWFVESNCYFKIFKISWWLIQEFYSIISKQ